MTKPDDLSVGELAADDEWHIIHDNEHYPQEDYSTPERETDLEQSEIERRENTNLRILEWMRDVKNENCEGQSIEKTQENGGSPLRLDGNRQSARHCAREFRPRIIDGDVDKYFCPGSGGRTYPHRNFDDKETQGSERNERIGTG